MKQVEATREPVLKRARASQMSSGEPIRGPRPHPPLDSHIGPLYLLCTAINAMPSWRPVFQFLISLLNHSDTFNTLRIDTSLVSSFQSAFAVYTVKKNVISISMFYFYLCKYKRKNISRTHYNPIVPL